MQSLGEPAYRGAQIYHALYAERRFDFAAMSNLPSALRQRLARESTIEMPRIVRRHLSDDGTVRYVLALGPQNPAASAQAGQPDDRVGNDLRLPKPATIEAVFMPEENRQTICISTQAGCAVDCHFCLTAHAGADSQSHRGRNRRAGARCARRKSRIARTANQRGADGPGRAAAQFRAGDGRGAHSARSQGDGDFAQARDALDQRHRSGHRAARAGKNPPQAWRFRSTLRATSSATRSCPSIANIRSQSCSKPAGVIRCARGNI